MIDSQTNSFIFDDVNIESQKIVVLEESPTFIKPLQFRVFLNGYNVTIKNLMRKGKKQLNLEDMNKYGTRLATWLRIRGN